MYKHAHSCYVHINICITYVYDLVIVQNSHHSTIHWLLGWTYGPLVVSHVDSTSSNITNTYVHKYKEQIHLCTYVRMHVRSSDYHNEALYVRI